MDDEEAWYNRKVFGQHSSSRSSVLPGTAHRGCPRNFLSTRHESLTDKASGLVKAGMEPYSFHEVFSACEYGSLFVAVVPGYLSLHNDDDRQLVNYLKVNHPARVAFDMLILS